LGISAVTWLAVLLVVFVAATVAFGTASRRLYGLQILIYRRGSDLLGHLPPPGSLTRFLFGYGFIPFLFSQVGHYVINGQYAEEPDEAIRKAGAACRDAFVAGVFLTLLTAGFVLLLAFFVLR